MFDPERGVKFDPAALYSVEIYEYRMNKPQPIGRVPTMEKLLQAEYGSFPMKGEELEAAMDDFVERRGNILWSWQDPELPPCICVNFNQDGVLVYQPRLWVKDLQWLEKP